MKRLKFKSLLWGVLIFCLLHFFSGSLVYSFTLWEKLDNWLIVLLNDETEPFFPDTIRHDFLRSGIKAVFNHCKISEFKRACQVRPFTGSNDERVGRVALPWTGDLANCLCNIIDITAIWNKNSTYALPQIEDRDAARKSIYTTSEMQYWFMGGGSAEIPHFYIYPPPADTDTVIVFGYGTPREDYVHYSYQHLVVLYALHLCYLRRGEGEIARYIKSLFDSLLQDMLAITEGRKVDATIKERVIP